MMSTQVLTYIFVGATFALYIGIATLFDTLRDNGLYDKKKEEQHRKLFQVPAPLLQTISVFGNTDCLQKYIYIMRLIINLV